MKRNLLIILFFLFFSELLAQQTDSTITSLEFHSEIFKLNRKIKALETLNSEFTQTNSFQKKQIDNLASQLSVAHSNIQQIADSLHITVANVSTANKQTQNQIHVINQTITT